MADLKVVSLYDSNHRDIPATLRLIADNIEKGTYGCINEAVVVTWGDELGVFALGNADGTTSHVLLAAAQRKIEAPFLG